MIIAVVHNLPPGGAHRRLASQLRHLHGDVVEVCLETATPIRQDATIVPFARTATRVPRALRPPLRYHDLGALERAWRRAAARIRELGAGVLYLNPCRFVQAPPVLFDGSPPSVYFCDEARRVDSESAAEAMRNPITRPIYSALYARERRLDRATAARATTIATNSRYSADAIERVYGRRADVVTMGVAEPMLRALGTGPRQRFVLSVGALIPGKGHELVLRAAAHAHTRPSVTIVAPRPAPVERDRLTAIAHELGVSLELRVGISDDELAALYRTAHATLYLARREPLGLASLEAQACGCPVIVADEGGLPETIVDGATGWKAPLDPAVASVLIDRLAERALHERMSAAAAEHARGWNWKTSASQIEELLADVATRRHEGVPAHV